MKWLPTITAILIFVSAGSVATADDENTKEAPDLTVATIQGQPLTVREAGSQRHSYGVSEAVALFEKCAIKAQVIYAPSWTRAFQMAASGKADALMPANWSTEREKLFHFPKTAYSSMAVLAFTARDNPALKYTGFDLFQGQIVGKLTGALLTSELDAFLINENISVVERPTLSGLFEALVNKEIHFAIDQTVLDARMKEALSVDDTVRALHPPIAVAPLYTAISRKGRFARSPDKAKFNCLMH